jgi:hypothetical protein
MSTVDAVTSVLSAGDAGYTADELAGALGLPIDGATLQPELEEMVEHGILDRCGIGRGALYTLVAPLPTTRDTSGHSGLVGKGPTTRLVG